MKTITSGAELRALLDEERRSNKKVGFVPTMGFLHEGHATLIRKAAEDNDIAVASIFVNPLQFGPTEDFGRYPRDPDGDSRKAEAAGADYLFMPTVDEMYPKGDIATTVDPGPIATVTEGWYRPGHFAGVATVCVKLFNQVGPCAAYFGKKDAQQLAVIRQVVADLDLPVEVVACETVREEDGLAMSSRNKYLDTEQRSVAPEIYRALKLAADRCARGETSAEVLIAEVTEHLEGTKPDIDVQYVAIVDPATFFPVETVTDSAVLAMAAFIGGTRLIDNIELVSTAPRP